MKTALTHDSVTSRNFLKTKVQLYQYVTPGIGVPKGTNGLLSAKLNILQMAAKNTCFQALKPVSTYGQEWTKRTIKEGTELRISYELVNREIKTLRICDRKLSISSARSNFSLSTKTRQTTEP